MLFLQLNILHNISVHIFSEPFVLTKSEQDGWNIIFLVNKRVNIFEAIFSSINLLNFDNIHHCLYD